MNTDFLAFITPAVDDVATQAAIEQARECILRFSSAFNRCDPEAMDAELRFPHLMLSGGYHVNLWIVTRESGRWGIVQRSY